MINVKKYVKVKTGGTDILEEQDIENVREPVIDPLNITPSTSSQSFMPSQGVDGFAPVNVSAVTASIDSNIIPENIKSGTTILGVNGALEEIKGTTITITPTTSEQEIVPTSPYNAFTGVRVEGVTASIDSDIVAGNIKSGVNILGVNGNVVELDGETVNITPTTSEQTITPTSPHNGITQATVSAVTSSIDANIQAGNIKNGTTILGTTGTYIKPAGYIPRAINNGEVTANTTDLIDFTGITTVGEYAFAYACYGNTNITSVSFTLSSNGVRQYGLYYAFAKCSSLTSFDITVNGYLGEGCFSYAFWNCTSLISADLTKMGYTDPSVGNKRMVNVGSSFYSCFSSCTSLISADLSGWYAFSGYAACSNLFAGCTSLESVDISCFVGAVGNDANSILSSAFSRCSKLPNIKFSSLKKLSSTSSGQLGSCFSGCTLLTDIFFPALISVGQYQNINALVNGVTGCTIHFPKNLDPQTGSTEISRLAGYPSFGGTNTVLAFDQPSTLLLTGANGTVYERNPKYDTATALAWRVQDTESSTTMSNGWVINWTPYYTSTLNDPQVNDTIYSDESCTTSVTTIDSIA